MKQETAPKELRQKCFPCVNIIIILLSFWFVCDFHTANIAIETLRSAPTKNILAESVNSENIAIQHHKPLNYLINFKISGMVIFL